MRRVWWLRIFLWLIFLVVYGLTAARSHLNYADSDDLTLAAFSGGLAHPPGYVWFTVGLGFLMRLLPMVSPALIANVSAAVLSSVNVLLFSYLLCRWLMHFKVNAQTAQVAGVLAAGWWGVSELVWRHATVVEVFPVAQLLMLLCCWAFLEKKYSLLIMGSVAAVLFHPLSVLLVGPAILWTFWRESKKPHTLFRGLLLAGLVVGLSVVLMLFIAGRAAPYGWPMAESSVGVLRFWWRSDLLAAGGSAVESLTAHRSVDTIAWAIRVWFLSVWSEWGAIAFILMVMGGHWWWKRGGYVVLIAAVITGPLLAAYMLFPEPRSSSEIAYFWGTALRLRMFFAWQLVAAVLVAGGVSACLMRLRKRFLLWVLVLMGVLVSSVWVRWKNMDASGDNVASVLAQSVLSSLPERAVLIVDSDMVFAFVYEQLVSGLRPDVSIVPSRIVVREIWWQQQKGHLYVSEYNDPVQQVADVVAWSTRGGVRVFLYAPDSSQLSYLGGEGNPFFVSPYGYTLEISRSMPDLLSSSDYGVSKQLISYPTASDDWWLKGFKAHLATIHAQAAYYYARLGLLEAARVHADVAIRLVSLPQSKQAIAESLEKGEKAFLNENSYAVYTPLPYDVYIRRAREALIRGEREAAEFAASRAALIEPEGLEAQALLSEIEGY